MLDPMNFAKLFQMIIMALKRQLLLMKNNAGVFHITRNHFQGVNKIADCSSESNYVWKTFSKYFDQLSKSGFYILKKKMMNLLVSKNHKIGMFMQDGTQDNLGNMIAKPSHEVAWNVGKLGAIFCNGNPTGILRGLKPYSLIKPTVNPC